MDDDTATPVGTREHSTDIVVGLERTHGQTLFGFVRRLGISDSAAADVVQESLVRLFDVLVGGQQIVDAKAWLFHTAYRLAMDEHRRFARIHRLASRLGSSPAVDSDPAERFERRLVWSAVDRLPERQRAVLYLRFRADLSFDAIASAMGITASAARSHSTQALASLRRMLNAEVVL
jgi:RNA polymerase sigma factor (sigma-70 family)